MIGYTFTAIMYMIVLLVVVVLMFLTALRIYAVVRDLITSVRSQSDACVSFVKHLSEITNDVLNNHR